MSPLHIIIVKTGAYLYEVVITQAIPHGDYWVELSALFSICKYMLLYRSFLMKEFLDHQLWLN